MCCLRFLQTWVKRLLHTWGRHWLQYSMSPIKNARRVVDISSLTFLLSPYMRAFITSQTCWSTRLIVPFKACGHHTLSLAREGWGSLHLLILLHVLKILRIDKSGAQAHTKMHSAHVTSSQFVDQCGDLEDIWRPFLTSRRWGDKLKVCSQNLNTEGCRWLICYMPTRDGILMRLSRRYWGA